MMEIFWTMLASQDRKRIREYIAEQNLMAAIELDERIGYRPTLSVRTNTISNRKETTSAARFILWRFGNISGLDEILPHSLPNATTEPVKVTAPMKIPRNTSVR